MKNLKKVLIVGGTLLAVGAVAGVIWYRKHGKEFDRMHKAVKDEINQWEEDNALFDDIVTPIPKPVVHPPVHPPVQAEDPMS